MPASSAAPPRAIPAAYRVFCTLIDPAIALGGAYMHFAIPETVLDAYIPAAVSSYEPQHHMLYQQLGGYLLGAAFLSIVLLRYTADVGVWRIHQAGALIIDLVILYAQGDTLAKQGRLSLAAIRPEEWGTIAILGTLVVIRTLFVAGIGFGRATPKVGKGRNAKRA